MWVLGKVQKKIKQLLARCRKNHIWKFCLNTISIVQHCVQGTYLDLPNWIKKTVGCRVVGFGIALLLSPLGIASPTSGNAEIFIFEHHHFPFMNFKFSFARYWKQSRNEPQRAKNNYLATNTRRSASGRKSCLDNYYGKRAKPRWNPQVKIFLVDNK